MDDALTEHLCDAHGLVVNAVRPLDVRVFECSCPTGDFIVRLEQNRRLDVVQEDARILQHLIAKGVPAEAPLTDKPVSAFEGHTVFVTHKIAGRHARGGRGYAYLGGILGALHAHPAQNLREGGGWHHLVSHGTPSDEIDAALALLGPDAPSVLVEALAELDDGTGLPQALAHPDPSLRNAIDTGERVYLIDWAGVGRTPRVWGLGLVLAIASRYGSARAVELASTRYLRRTQLTEEELDRLEGAMLGRMTTWMAWSFAHGHMDEARVIHDLGALRGTAARGARQFRQLQVETGLSPQLRVT